MNKFLFLVALAPLVAMACSSNNDNSGPPPLPEVSKSSLAYNSVPVVSTDTQQAVINDLNNFGSAVFQSLAPTDQNFAISPASGFIVLTMTSDGAQGTTADQMKAVLYPDVSVGDIQAATNQLEQRVRGYARPPNGDKKVELDLANDAFVQKDMTIQQPFLDNLATNYNCGLELVDFKTNPGSACSLINNWVANETNNLIQNLVSPGAINNQTRLVLVDALYMYASWNTAFDPNNTKAQTFHGINGDSSTDFMSGEQEVNYAAGTGWVSVDVPYYNGPYNGGTPVYSLVFTAVLPDAGQFDTVKANVNAAWFANFDTSAQLQQVSLTLPKFNLSGSSVSWAQTLEALGMTTLFDSNTCDLTGISNDTSLYVSDVVQQVYVNVAEKGTEAAAATAVIGTAAGIPPPTSVVLDRPFLFYVREPGGPILFAGQVVSLP